MRPAALFLPADTFHFNVAMNQFLPPVVDTHHNPWQTMASEVKYQNPWISVREDAVLNPGGGRGIYGVVTMKNKALGIVPVDADGNTWLVGQYRYPLNEYSWEIPMGGGLLEHDILAPIGRHDGWRRPSRSLAVGLRFAGSHLRRASFHAGRFRRRWFGGFLRGLGGRGHGSQIPVRNEKKPPSAAAWTARLIKRAATFCQ